MQTAPATIAEKKSAENRISGSTPATTIGTLISSFDSSIIELLVSPGGLDVEIRSMALLEDSDIDGTEPAGALSDVYLPVGVLIDSVIDWLVASEHKPKLMLVKNAVNESALRAAAEKSGIALASVHPQASSGHIYSLIQQLLIKNTYRRRTTAQGSGLDPTGDSDLFALSETVAELTGGLVTINDNAQHILAHSIGHENEDELHQRSVLGREWPSGYSEWLQKRGTFEHLRRSDEIIDIPAAPEFGAAHRLAVSIRRRGTSVATSGVHQQHLGTIWVQTAGTPLHDGSDEVLRGASRSGLTHRDPDPRRVPPGERPDPATVRRPWRRSRYHFLGGFTLTIPRRTGRSGGICDHRADAGRVAADDELTAPARQRFPT